MKLVYIAGAYRAKENTTVEQNIAAAKNRAVRVCAEVLKYNWYPVTPHLNTAHFEDEGDLRGVPDEYWLAGTLEMMKRCDAVLLVNRHSAITSAGTTAEVKAAYSLGIPVFGTMTEFIGYAEQNN